MAILTTEHRDKLKAKTFAIPKGRKYPIHDEAHARNALARVRQHGTPEERNQVYSAVAKKYPGLAERSSIKNVQRRVKTAAPIALIRKLAAEDGEYIKDRRKEIGKEHSKAQREHGRLTDTGSLLGGLGGAALGGYLGSRVGVPITGGMAGFLGGSALGQHLSGGSEGAALREKMKQLQNERSDVDAMRPGSTGPLTQESLDVDRYHGARARAAKASLDLMDTARPVRIGTSLGLLGGGVAGNLLGRGLSDRQQAALMSAGLIGGSLLGAGGGLIAAGYEGRNAMSKALSKATHNTEVRDNIWRAASRLGEDTPPVEEVRKAAGAVAFQMLTEDPTSSSTQFVTSRKWASVEDQELFKIASGACIRTTEDGQTRSLEDCLDLYEAMGGTYKHAFGVQMFDTKQMAGSPALTSGVRQRSMTQPTAPQAAPTAPSSTSNSGQPKSQSTSAPSMTSAQSGSSGGTPSPAGTTTITI